MQLSLLDIHKLQCPGAYSMYREPWLTKLTEYENNELLTIIQGYQS